MRHQTISFFRRFSLRQVEQQLHQHNQEMARRLESVEPQMQQHFLELQDIHEKFTVRQLVARSRASGPSAKTPPLVSNKGSGRSF